MESFIQLGLNFGLILLLCVIGYLFGTFNERRHLRSIIKREKDLAPLLVFSGAALPDPDKITDSGLVIGSVVIAEDAFKALLATIRNIVGGRVGSYESLLDRGRREALLRLKAQARESGASTVCNVRFTTARIARGFEIMAFGTAIRHGPANRT